MEVLVISVQPLSLSTWTNSHRQAGVQNCFTRIRMLCLAIEVMGRLVNKDGQQFFDQGIYQPFFSGGLAARNESAAASCFWWEEIPLILSVFVIVTRLMSNLPRPVRLQVWQCISMYPFNGLQGSEVLDD